LPSGGGGKPAIPKRNHKLAGRYNLTVSDHHIIVYTTLHKWLIKMSASLLKVGVREFRTHLQQYILMSSPVSITRHGETVGYYIPTKIHSEKSDVDGLKLAAAKLENLLAEHGVTEEELLSDFEELKRGNKK